MRKKKVDDYTKGLDMTKPLPIAELIANVETDDCYSKEWKPTDSMCSICSALEMCGILYNSRQRKAVQKLDKEKGFLDLSDFEGIEYDDVYQWLCKKQRTTQDLIKAITKLSKCSDETTVMYWCKSFIKDNLHRLKTEKGLIIIK